jgi:demethylmenaquinone methyltransferase/2-methoxy-6-polyprenyl-1,4-benzoquinol methylase
VESGNIGAKRKDVELMFDSIAVKYDFLNHFLSLGTDFFWRQKAISVISKTHKPDLILDVATGTCDLAIAALKLKPKKVTGIDISAAMLAMGKNKLDKRNLNGLIELIKAESENIPFPDNYFDVSMSAFGVRNFSDTVKGLSEMCRVTCPGGLIMVLEFSKPTAFPFSQLYYFYFKRVLPFFGWLFSRNRRAYDYLPESVANFSDGQEFMILLEEAGFRSVTQKRLSGGIATIYTGLKPLSQ